MCFCVCIFNLLLHHHRFECYLVLQRAEATHEAAKAKEREGTMVVKPKVKPPPAFLGGPRARPFSSLEHDHADGHPGDHPIEPGARDTNSRAWSRAGSRVGTPGGSAGAANGDGNSLLLGKCGFWNPLVGLKVLQKLTDALAAAEEEDLAKASAASKQNSSSRGSSRRNSKEPLSPKMEPLSPKTSKEPLSPSKEPLSPQKEPLSPATAASGQSSWIPKTKEGGAAAGQTGTDAGGSHHHHPVQFIYAQTVSFSRHTIGVFFSGSIIRRNVSFFIQSKLCCFFVSLSLLQLATAKTRAKKFAELEKCEKKLERLVHEGKGGSTSANELKTEVHDFNISLIKAVLFFK